MSISSKLSRPKNVSFALIMNLPCHVALIFTLAVNTPVLGAATNPPVALASRFIAIDNVCCWPNLNVLPDGTIIATIFNQPSHARMEGDVECWSSTDGQFWTKRGVAAKHEPMANRMNVAAGLTHDDQLVVLASGWSLTNQADGKLALGSVLPVWSIQSRDGREWQTYKQAFSPTEPDKGNLIPFGNLFPAADGSLRATAYSYGQKGPAKVLLMRSDDDGKTWHTQALIAEDHNETALFFLGGKKWIAASRRSQLAVDLYFSDDDGNTWRRGTDLNATDEGPAHFLRLKDGRLLLSTGNRNPGQYGVLARLSSDDGNTWTSPLTVVSDAMSSDCGYPSSVERPDGKIVTVYYARSVPDHQRYHMGVVLWSPPATGKP